MKLRAQGFSTNKRQGLVGTIVVLTDDDQTTGIEHFGNYSRDGAKGLFKKLEDAGHDQEPVRPKLQALLAELRSVADAANGPANPTDTQPEVPYMATPTGLVWLKQSEEGLVPVPLTNFTAQIVSEQLSDDGVEVQRTYQLEAVVNGQTHRFSVPAAQFSGMGWTADHLGAQAVVYPGLSIRDHARAGIQLLSGQVPTQIVFTHTGWRQVNGIGLFLHGDGGIGPMGSRSDVAVDLPDSLRGFRLPEPPSGDDLRTAVRASLEFLEVAGDVVVVPMYCSIWWGVLGRADHSGHLSGPTGAGKSEVAALAQQHFGAEMDARHLPANWSSTANALEGLAFAAKDVLLVVDDFAPTGSPADIQRLHRDADRLLRAQGNHSGRLRMRSDSSLRVPRPPRGQIQSTGEDVPNGQSLRARLMVSEIPLTGPGSVNWERLTVCQEYAATGRFAQVMSAYLRWLSPRYQEIQESLYRDLADMTARVRAAQGHRRTPYNVAGLAVGLDYFLKFASEVGAITQKEADEIRQRARRALVGAAAEQQDHQAASEPAQRFIQLLPAAIASGRAHVANPWGGRPHSPESWGWREVVLGTGDSERTEWRPQGLRIGWVQGEDLYLQSDAAYAEAQRLAKEGGDALSPTLQTLKKRLKEKGLLASTENVGGRERLEVRRTLEGSRRTVLHLKSSTLMPPEVRQVRQVCQDEVDLTSEAPNSDAGPGALFVEPDEKVRPQSEPPGTVDERQSSDNGTNGTNGALGTLFEGIPAESTRESNGPVGKQKDPWDSFLEEAEE